MTSNEHLIARYLEEVYTGRDPEAARRYLADPCVRHGHGVVLTLSLDDNVARIRQFHEEHPDFVCTASRIFAGPEHTVLCYDLDLGDGNLLSAVEVFRIVDGTVTENWNTVPTSGAWT